jgi:hypothetical protein
MTRLRDWPRANGMSCNSGPLAPRAVALAAPIVLILR